MGDTYTQLFVHIIFSVQNRASLINENIRDRLEKYICGIVQNMNSKVISVYCNPDHLHLLISYDQSISIADLVRVVKSNSSKLINDNRLITGKFHWQEGYAAFTCSKSHLDRIAEYIENQPKHHKKKTFREEYIAFLDKYGIEYNLKYFVNLEK